MDTEKEVKLYLVNRDPGDENDFDARSRLTPPPRPLQKGERWDGTNIFYSADWIDEERAFWLDEEGTLHEFGR